MSVFGAFKVRVFPYSAQMPENKDQKNSENRHFSCSVLCANFFIYFKSWKQSLERLSDKNLFPLIVAEIMNSAGSILNLDVAAFKSLADITVETSEKFDTYIAGRHFSISFLFKGHVDVISNMSIYLFYRLFD